MMYNKYNNNNKLHNKDKRLGRGRGCGGPPWPERNKTDISIYI